MKRIFLICFIIVMLFSLSASVMAQDETPEVTPTTESVGDVTVESGGGIVTEDTGTVTVQEGGSITVIEDAPDPLAPLLAILTGIGGLMVYITPVIYTILANFKGLPEWVDDVLIYAVIVILSLLALYQSPVGTDVFGLVGADAGEYNRNFGIIITGLAMGFGANFLRVFFTFLDTARKNQALAKKATTLPVLVPAPVPNPDLG